MKIELNRIDDAFHFEAIDENGKSALMDAGKSIGGNNKGVSPMQMLLMGLGGCAAIDVVLILKKQKQVISDFSISMEAHREPNKEPSLWKTIVIQFKLKGNIELEKAERAVQLSMKKYCSVARTLELAGANIQYTVGVTLE